MSIKNIKEDFWRKQNQQKNLFGGSKVINEKSHHCGDILGAYRRVWFSKKHISCGLQPPLIYFFGEPDSCDILLVHHHSDVIFLISHSKHLFTLCRWFSLRMKLPFRYIYNFSECTYCVTKMSIVSKLKILAIQGAENIPPGTFCLIIWWTFSIIFSWHFGNIFIILRTSVFITFQHLFVDWVPLSTRNSSKLTVEG